MYLVYISPRDHQSIVGRLKLIGVYDDEEEAMDCVRRNEWHYPHRLVSLYERIYPLTPNPERQGIPNGEEQA